MAHKSDVIAGALPYKIHGKSIMKMMSLPCVKLGLPLLLLAIIVIASGCSKTLRTSGEVSVDSSGESSEARTVLEKGKVLGEIPTGVVIRVAGCMGAAKDGTPKAEQELVELWELTTGEVHRVECEYEGGKPVHKRIETRKCDTTKICRELLEDRAIEIEARKGTGPESVLAGTIYEIGSRSVEVELNGHVILKLFETNGPFLEAYKQTDAEAFGKLYDRLAVQARRAF